MGEDTGNGEERDMGRRQVKMGKESGEGGEGRYGGGGER